jgi:membrane-associated phospholipid phosphatase
VTHIPPRGRLAVVLLGSLVVLAVLTMAVSDQAFLVGETASLQAINEIPSALGWQLRVVMELGTVRVALLVVAATGWCTRDRGPVPAVTVLVAATTAYWLDDVIKGIVERPRPAGLVADLHVREHIGGFGFPSGHTTMAWAIAASLHPTLPVRWRPIAWVLAALVGLARMYVGVHWPADAVGGAALGIAIGSASWLLMTGLPGLGDARPARSRR